MKKIVRSLFCAVTILGSIYAHSQQQLPNQSFENWDNVGSSTEEPTEWNGMMTGDMCSLCGSAQSQRVFREGSDVHSGSYSARIETGSAFFGTVGVNGAITLGRVTAPAPSASSGYNQTLTGDPDFSEAFSSTPDSLVFWAKYVPNGSDSARVSINLHTNYNQADPYSNDPQTNTNVIAFGAKNFRTGGVWKRISLPINYCEPSSGTPEYVLSTFTSSKTPGSTGGIGSVLYIDDTELIYNTSNPTNSISPVAQQNIITNTNGTQLSVEDNGSVSREWKYATTSGGSYSSFGTAETGMNYTPNFGTAGTYYVICESTYCDKNATVATSSEVEIVVTDFANSIAPTATQNIDENVAGTQLNVTENATPDSREWKFGTTSGGSYSSFGTPETGANYTPLFATAGTYYVVCESTLGGTTVTSNEVEIVVSPTVNPTVSIAPTATQTILINEDGNTLTATEANGTVSSREWKFGSASGGPYASFGTPETASTYTPNFGTAGTYYVVCETDFGGSTVTSNEVEIIVETPSNSIAPTATQNIDENVAGTQLDVTESHTATSREWLYSTTSGSGYTSFGTPETSSSYTPLFASAGTYYVICESNFAGGNTVTSNEVEIVVSAAASNAVSIAPTATQNLMENQTGTMLTATESPSAASSREWMYSTTSGSSYQSFSPAETGTTYAPMFATAGTYYVVCESDFSGSAVTSNEVQVNVTTSSIEENGVLSNVNIYSYVNNIVIDASALTSENYTIEIMSVSGQVIQTTSIQGGERKELTTDFAEGIYIVSIFNDQVQKQVKLYIQ